MPETVYREILKISAEDDTKKGVDAASKRFTTLAKAVTTPLSITATVVDKATAPLRGIASQVLSLQGLLAGALGAGGIGALALAIGTSMDDASDTIRATTGATGDALNGLEDDFKAVFQSVPTDAHAAAAALADLSARTGLTGDALQALTTAELQLANLTGGDLNEQVAATTRLFGDWSIAGDQQAATLDKLFRAGQATGQSVEALAQQVVQFGGPLRQLGFDFDTSIGLLGKFEREGVNTELVMGSLRIALGKMAKAGVGDAKAGLMTAVKAIKDAGSAGEANAKALALFGARAGPDMAAAIREGRFEIASLLDTIEHGSDTISSATADTADFAEKFQILRNKATVALEPLGDLAFSVLGAIADELGNIDFAGIAAAAKSLGDIGKKAIVPIMTGAKALAVAFSKDEGALGIIGDLLEDAFGPDIANMIRKDLLQPAMNALRWIRTTGLPWITKKANEVFAWIRDVGWPWVQDAAQKVLDFVLPIWETIRKKAEDAYAWIADVAWPWISQKALEVRDIILPIWEQIRKAAADAYTWIRDTAWPWISQKALEIRDIVVPIWEKIRKAAEDAYTWIRDVAWPWISAKAQEVKDIILPIWEEMRKAAEAAYAWIRDVAWPWISAKAEEVMAAIRLGWNTILGTVGEVLGWVRDVAWPWVREGAETAFTWIRDTGWPMVSSAAAKAMADSRKAVETFWAELMANKTVDKYLQILGNFLQVWKDIALIILEPVAGVAVALAKVFGLLDKGKATGDSAATTLDKIADVLLLISQYMRDAADAVLEFERAIGRFVQNPDFKTLTDILGAFGLGVAGIGSAAGSAARALIGGGEPAAQTGGALHRAAGGPVTGGTAYVVGENGPETFIPGRSGSIVPNGGLTAGDIHLHFAEVPRTRAEARRVAYDVLEEVLALAHQRRGNVLGAA